LAQFKPVWDTLSEMTPKLTAQQILHQQMVNRKKALDIQKWKKGFEKTSTVKSSSRERPGTNVIKPFTAVSYELS
jgi:hypothetical protein